MNQVLQNALIVMLVVAMLWTYVAQAQYEADWDGDEG